jgi:acetate kinase
MNQVILCINSGSSSLKFALYQMGNTEEERIATGAVEGIGLAGGRLWIKAGDGKTLVDRRRDFVGCSSATDSISAAARELGLPLPTAAGHRVVYGGPNHSSPELVDARFIQGLRDLIPFAPLHLPSAIYGMEAVAARYPDLPQVACFDTAFHRRMPQVAQRFPLLRNLWDEGIRRYGFHGLSFEYILGTLDQPAQRRLLIAHLGNGASLAAIRNGLPLDTTMGFTPTGGLMMGTRSGDLDPGVLLYLMTQKRCEAGELDALLNQRAGLWGVSGISSDMKTLLDQRDRAPHAAEAVELFCYQARKHLGAMTAVLGGLDTLVFTGGMGERAAPVRWEICQGLEYLGIVLDEKRNASNSDVISAPESRCAVRVIPTNEDLMIARHTYRFLDSQRNLNTPQSAA